MEVIFILVVLFIFFSARTSWVIKLNEYLCNKALEDIDSGKNHKWYLKLNIISYQLWNFHVWKFETVLKRERKTI